MKQIRAKTIVSDMQLQHAIAKKDIEKRIKNELSRSLAEHIIQDEVFEQAIIKRKNLEHEYLCYGGTEFEVCVFLMTDLEVKEYEELKKLRVDIRKLVI